MTKMTRLNPADVVARWTNPETRPNFAKGELAVKNDGVVCRCAQGDILHIADWRDDQMNDQEEADTAVAELLGISLFESVLLRTVNDSEDGCPETVLSNPGALLGPHGDEIVALARHLDTLGESEWESVVNAWDHPSFQVAGSLCQSALDASDVWPLVRRSSIANRAGGDQHFSAVDITRSAMAEVLLGVTDRTYRDLVGFRVVQPA